MFIAGIPSDLECKVGLSFTIRSKSSPTLLVLGYFYSGHLLSQLPLGLEGENLILLGDLATIISLLTF